MRKIDEILNKLENLDLDNVSFEVLEELVEEIRSCSDGEKAIVPVLRFIERNEDKDLGMPGSLVHWLEEFYENGFEEKLLESLKRKPTFMNLWMLKRLINANDTNKQNYQRVLSQIADDKNLSSELVDLAKRFATK